MKKFGLFAVIALFFLLSSLSSAATYYVSSSTGKDTNTGTSSSSPWKTIAKVNLFTFKPGDVILFSRGGYWNETLTVKQSGTSAYPITFGAYGSGNLPVINGGNSRLYGINIVSRSYIIVKNIKIQNTTHGAVYISRSRYITVRNSEMYVTGRAGVFIQESSYSLITLNKITTPSTFYNVQTDGIYGQRNSYNSYDGNNIVISNQHTDQHCDAIQLYQETGGIIKNNYVEQNNTKTGNSQGIYTSENYGVTKIFNNVGYALYTNSSLIKFKNFTTTGRSEIIGNTVYGGKGGLIQVNDPNVILKNNILFSTGEYAVLNLESAISSKSNIANNLYRRLTPGKNIIVNAGRAYTMTQWIAAGYDLKGKEADPKFSNVSGRIFSLLSGSPALNAGVNLSSPYNVDRSGTPRPSGAGTDMGAYEMTGLGKEDSEETLTPGDFVLEQNYPNPFNPSTTIRFTLPENSVVNLKVYDITGSEVADLLNEEKSAGVYEINFDASNLASGTYIYTITAKDFFQSKKMVLLK